MSFKSTAPLVAGLAITFAGPLQAAESTPAKPTPAPSKVTTSAADSSVKNTTISPTNTNTMPASASPAPFEFIESQGRKNVLVCSIKTVEANRQFQQNVNVVQAQLQQVKTLRQREADAFTTVEKEAIRTKLGEVEKQLEQNNSIMAKTYGFSILRQYTVEIVKTRLYTPITDEEYTKAKAEKDFKEDHYIVNENGKFAHVATISGVAENNIFRQNVQLVQNQRQRLAQLQQAKEQTKDADAKAKLEEEFKKSEETLVKNNNDMAKTYGFSLVRNYTMEIEEAKLYMGVTDEEFAKQKAEAEKAGTAAPAAKTEATAPAGAAK